MPVLQTHPGDILRIELGFNNSVPVILFIDNYLDKAAEMLGKIDIQLMLVLLASIAMPAGAETCVSTLQIGEKAIITGAHVNLRERASVQSDTVGKTQIGLTVEILEVSDRCDTIGDKTAPWARISGETQPIAYAPRRYEGWVFGAFLADIERFTPVTQWSGFARFWSCYGHYCLNIETEPDGRFRAFDSGFDEPQGPEQITELGEGRMYKYRNLLWMRYSDSEGGYVVVRDAEGRYCLGDHIDPQTGVCASTAEDAVTPTDADTETTPNKETPESPQPRVI